MKWSILSAITLSPVLLILLLIQHETISIAFNGRFPRRQPFRSRRHVSCQATPQPHQNSEQSDGRNFTNETNSIQENHQHALVEDLMPALPAGGERLSSLRNASRTFSVKSVASMLVNVVTQRRRRSSTQLFSTALNSTRSAKEARGDPTQQEEEGTSSSDPAAATTVAAALVSNGYIKMTNEGTTDTNDNGSNPDNFQPISTVASVERLQNGAEETATTDKTPVESVHLRLGSAAMMPQANTSSVEESEKEAESTTMSGEANDSETQSETEVKKSEKAIFHTFHRDRTTLYGLNLSRRKFEAWVKYKLRISKLDPATITTKTLDLTNTHQNDDVRENLRDMWKNRTLVCDRTELLTRYQSDNQDEEPNEAPKSSLPNETDETDPVSESTKKKRGGFSDLLHLYADRFQGILQDEEEEKEAMSALLTQEQTIPHDHRDGGMLNWLQREYGMDQSSKMQAHHLLAQEEEAQKETIQHFLDWFRSNFPYYYDRCDACGASYRDDRDAPKPETEQTATSENNTSVDVVAEEKDGDDDDDEDDDDGSFIGYVHPSDEELKGKAGRTELYQCHKCGEFSRFPRCNSAKSVIENRRGRCGEYSMLMYRMLRSLGHDARWVVDWADHVWSEIRIAKPHSDDDDGRWIHVDPCEAAFDNNLLYQEWGKQQTYIVAFHAPLPDASSGKSIFHGTAPFIEDVTRKYTSDTMEVIQSRREETEEEVEAAIELVTRLSHEKQSTSEEETSALRNNTV